jgi:hypothetical protein
MTGSSGSQKEGTRGGIFAAGQPIGCGYLLYRTQYIHFSSIFKGKSTAIHSQRFPPPGFTPVV